MTITFPYQSFITREDILENGGYDINKLLIDDRENIEQVADGFLKEIAKMIYTLISLHKGALFAKEVYAECLVDEALKETIKLAQYHQAIYIFENGDLMATNGINGNNIIALSEIRGLRSYSQNAIDELMNAGLFYTGIK